MYKVGIDLGESDIRIGIVDEDYQMVYQDSVVRGEGKNYQDTIKELAELIQESIHRADLNRKKDITDNIVGIGIGCPGAVDAEQGIVVFSDQMKWENVPIMQELHKYINYPIAISNDANCVALGEVKAGAAKDVKNMVLLTFKIGVGGGIIYNGRIFEGGHAGGTELGHTILVRDGKQCACGRKGCLEAYASKAALLQQVKETSAKTKESLLWKLCENESEKLTTDMIFRAAEEGDAEAKKVIETYISYLGDGIVDFVNIFRPDKVLLSEAPTNRDESFIKPLNEYLKRHCFAGEKGVIPSVTCTTLGDKAGMIGASALIEK